MSKQYRPSVFRGAANRDKNETTITAVLDRWHVEYSKGKPGDGYDLLVQINPLELWEVKDPSQKWTLTNHEKAKQAYCRERGIPYRVIQFDTEAEQILMEHFQKGGR